MSVKKPARKPTEDKRAADSSAKFEELLTNANATERFVFHLYITGNTIRSVQAIANIRAVCEDYLPGQYKLEVVDIYQQPSAAAREQIIAAPTLIKKLPIPVRRLIGNLSDRGKILVGLNLTRVRDSSRKPLKTR